MKNTKRESQALEATGGMVRSPQAAGSVSLGQLWQLF